MRYIIEMIFWVAAAVIVGFFGSSRREEKRVDANKTVMRQNPSLRYGMYLLGVLIVGMFVFFGTMAIRDEAQKEEPWTILLIFLGILFGAGCFIVGYIFYAKHVFFDETELLIGRPFKKMLHVKWQEIGRMEMQKNKLVLYGADGKWLVGADLSWENFDLFADMAKRMCSAKEVKKGGDIGSGERVMKRRAAGVAMLILAVLLLFICAFIAFAGEYTLAQMFAGKTMIFFPFLFAAGLAALFYAIFLFRENIRYTKEEIVYGSLFGKKKFLWRSLRNVRYVKEERGGIPVQKLYLTWEGKERVVSSKKYPGQFDEFLDFVIGVALMGNIPTQGL